MRNFAKNNTLINRLVDKFRYIFKKFLIDLVVEYNIVVLYNCVGNNFEYTYNINKSYQPIVRIISLIVINLLKLGR